jgi:hypothetical protein
VVRKDVEVARTLRHRREGRRIKLLKHVLQRRVVEYGKGPEPRGPHVRRSLGCLAAGAKEIAPGPQPVRVRPSCEVGPFHIIARPNLKETETLEKKIS